MALSEVLQKPVADRREDFNLLVRRCHRQAYNVSYRLSGNHADAEDITQEAFVRAFRFFDRYNPALPFENWLYRIISNVFIDEVRRRPKTPHYSLDQTLMGENGETNTKLEIADLSSDPQALVTDRELDEPLQKGLNALPPEFREAVVLADIEGLSYEEIAQVMGCSLGTVRSRLHRGRKQLRLRVTEFMGR